jgi:hypothetical protein
MTTADIALLEAYAWLVADRARRTLAEIRRDCESDGAYGWGWGHPALRCLLAPVRSAIDEAARVSALAARAREGRADPRDVATAAEAVRCLLEGMRPS